LWITKSKQLSDNFGKWFSTTSKTGIESSFNIETTLEATGMAEWATNVYPAGSCVFIAGWARFDTVVGAKSLCVKLHLLARFYYLVFFKLMARLGFLVFFFTLARF
jgi:hypothetical protein